MRIPSRLYASAVGAALAVLSIPSHSAAQSGRGGASADTVRGRAVVDSVPLAKVAIRVVSLPDSASPTTMTDARGEFSVTFDQAGPATCSARI
jgi:hypothetical protein